MSVIYIRNAETGKFEPVLSLQGPPGNVGPEGPQGPPGEGVLPPLVGTKDEITPTQVKEAIDAGREVRISMQIPAAWLTFTEFILREEGNYLYVHASTYIGGGCYFLTGNTNTNKWTMGRDEVKNQDTDTGGSTEAEAPTLIPTASAKPSDLVTPLMEGTKVWIQHIDATYGLLIFTSYVIQSADGENFTLVCSAVFNLDGTPTLGQLVGGYITNDTWQFSVTPLAMPVV